MERWLPFLLVLLPSVAAGCLSRPTQWTPDLVASAPGDAKEAGADIPADSGHELAADLSADVPAEFSAEVPPETSLPDLTDGVACVPACEGKVCGDDGCGGQCGECALSLQCTSFGSCVVPGKECEPGLAPPGTCDAGYVADTLVNTQVEAGQCMPDVASTGDGGFVVVWSSCPSCGSSAPRDGDPGSGDEPGQDNAGCGIFAQLFGPTGQRIGGEFKVNTTWKKSQFRPTVAGFNGGFGVLWFGWHPGAVWNLYFQLFDASGKPMGQETKVTEAPPHENVRAYLAMNDAAQDVAAVWAGEFVPGGPRVAMTRTFHLDWKEGVVSPTSAPTIVVEPMPNLDWCGATGIDNQHYVITWSGDPLEDGQGEDTHVDSYGRILRFDGTPPTFGDEPFLLGMDDSGWEMSPAVDGQAAEAGTGFAAAYTQAFRIRLRYFPEGDLEPPVELLVADDAAHTVDRPDVALASDGSIMVVWQRSPEVEDVSQEWGVFGRVYGPDLEPKGDEVHVNHYVPEEQYGARVAARAGGGFAVVWQSCFNQDGGGGCGIFAQAFGPDGKKLPLAANP